MASEVAAASKIESPRKNRTATSSPVKSVMHVTTTEPADLSKSLILVAKISEDKPTRRSRSRSPTKRRRLNAMEKEAQERIDRENRILLKKILEQHHGVRRSASIPPVPSSCIGVRTHRFDEVSNFGGSGLSQRRVTSNQINQQRRKHKTDYENLLLLQKIQNARPSNTIASNFQRRYY